MASRTEKKSVSASSIKGPALNLASFTPYRVAVLGRRMSEALGEAYAGENLTIPEWRVLAVVSQAPAMAARDVVAMTPMDKMAVSRAASSLEQKGLVQRRNSDSDRRVADLSLTERGAKVFGRVAVIAEAYETRVLAALTKEERRAFLDALEKLETETAIDDSQTS